MTRLLRLMAAVLATSLIALPSARADDNAIAYRLFEEARYAEAAELFSDQAWKGIAFYRSGQFWRAAEAFVRANDIQSMHNLGNTYVKLGYPALALEAYLSALAIDPEFEDARFNAELMKKIIARQQEERNQPGMRPNAREIDRVNSDPEEAGEDPDGAQESQKEQDEQRDGGSESTDRGEAAEQAGTQGSSGGQGDGSESADRPEEARSNVEGDAAPQETVESSAGGSKSTTEAAGSQAAGVRIELEKQQANAQWLNAIKDDPAKFLQRRIALEMRRRAASGTLPRPGKDGW